MSKRTRYKLNPDDSDLPKVLHRIFNDKSNKDYFPHIWTSHIREALEAGNAIYDLEKGGVLIWRIMKSDSRMYVGKKGDFQIKQIAVIEASKGTGLAIMLFRRAQKLALDNNCQRMFLSVRKDNKRAQAFYGKMGMKMVKEINTVTKKTRKRISYLVYLKELKSVGLF